MGSAALQRLGRHTALLFAVSLIFGLTAYAGITLTRDSGRIAAVWAPNAILLCVLLKAKREAWLPLLATCFVSNVIANLAVGDAAIMALSLSAINALEICAALFTLNYLGVTRPGFTEYRQIGVFALVAILACSLSSLCASLYLYLAMQAEISAVFWEWFRADALGLLVVTPALTILVDAWSQRHKLTRRMIIEGVLIIGVGTSISVYTFWQTRFPFLFLDAPIVLLYAFRLGALGNAIAILNLAIVASIATTYGHGPINLVRGDLSDKLFVLQVFLASSFAIGLPIAALLRGKRLAEDRFKQIAELSPVGIFQTSSSGELLYANAALWDQVGSREQLLRSTLWETLSEVPSEKGESTVFREFSGRTLRVRSQRIENDEGEHNGILGAVIDLTSETAAQQRLLEAKRTFETLTDLSPAGIFRTAADGNCTYVNRAWESLAGMDAFCAIGKGWTRSLHAEDRNRVVRTWEAATANGDGYADEFRFAHSDGSIRWAAVLARPEKKSDGSIAAYVGVAMDITDRKSAEIELLEARRQADEAAASKSQFLANMSHEIRTPMNGVLGFAQILAKEDLPQAQKQMIELIVQSGKNMLSLLNDILDVSKMEAGKLTLVSEPINVRQQILMAVEALSALAQNKGLELTCNVAPAVPDVLQSDPLRLRQILNNVIGNAIKFTDEGTVSVYVSVEDFENNDMLKIRVTDTGVGIAPEKLAMIFGYFDQADGGVSNRFGGTGLGLAITKNLVAAFGGSVEVQSGIGSGSIFNIRLPIVGGRGEDPVDMSLVSQDDASTVESPLEPLRLLVAEDNEINVLVLQSMLERLGLQATIASNGLEALQIIDDATKTGQRFDLVLMDIRMPEMDGLEATRQLRERGYSAEDLPIVALTANSSADDIENCRRTGMQGHLSKPLAFEKLRAALVEFGARRGLSAEGQGRTVDRLAIAYKEQRDRMFANLALYAAKGFDHGALMSDMHQIAGTAAYFNEREFGEACREGEAALMHLTGLELREKLEQLFAFQRVSR